MAYRTAESTWRATSAMGRPSAMVRSRSTVSVEPRPTVTPRGASPPSSPRRPSHEPPANPVTPYEPRVAARTTSITARRDTSDRPGVSSRVGLDGTPRASSRGAGSWGRAGIERGAGAIIPPRSGPPAGPARVSARTATQPTLTPDLFEDHDGPLLCDLRKGLDGRLHPPVVGDDPRPSSPPLSAQSPALHDP